MADTNPFNNIFDNENLQPDNEARFGDPTYKGEKLLTKYGVRGADPDRHTDTLCCAVFAAYVVGMLVVHFLTKTESDFSKATKLLESEGHRCGKDKGFEDYPFLLIFKFNPPFKSVCVKTCPNFDYNQMRYNSTGNATAYIRPVYFLNFTDAVELRKLLVPSECYHFAI